MHIATIAQIAEQPDFLGATHPAFPGKTLVKVSTGFVFEDLEGNQTPVLRGMPREGWERVQALA